MNFKNELQELCQKRGFPVPTYSPGPSTGPSHCPTFVRRVCVKWDGEELEVKGEGHSKKEADKKAAENMLQRIKAQNGQSGQSPWRSRSSIDPDPYDKPVPSPSRVKGRLQEVLQKSIYNYPPPEYELVDQKGPAHKKEFAVKCVIKGHQSQVLEQQLGYGATKKEAEVNAASILLPIIESKFDSGIPLSPRPHRSTPPPAVVDPQLDEDISQCLKKFNVRFDCRQGEQDVYLCLARASQGRLELPMAAQGMSMESESAAKRDAALNLIHSLELLGYS